VQPQSAHLPIACLTRYDNSIIYDTDVMTSVS
jgi:hypothetical protein